MSAILVTIGAAIFMFLGVAHAVFTFRSSPDGGPMMPTNPATREAMQVEGGLGLAPDLQAKLHTSWIGFNLSHSLGVIVVAAVLSVVTITDFDAAAGNPWFVGFAVITPVLYLALAQCYWFDQPRNAIAVGTAAVWAGVALELL